MDFFQGVQIDKFQRQYSAYTGAFCGKENIDEGGKIILPASALQEIAGMNIVWPIMFKITNTKKNLISHCGVLEFSAEEGRVYIPFWLQEQLQLSPGQIVSIQNATLEKGSFVKIRPQQKAFVDLSDPKAILEQKLRNFSCLTKGDTIIIKHLSKSFAIDILEVKGQSTKPCSAISIVETDVKVEFDRPLDMPPSPIQTPPESTFDFKKPATTTTTTNKPAAPSTTADKDTVETPTKSGFVPFVGQGRRLDGKNSATTTNTTSTTNTTTTTKQPANATTNTTAPKQAAPTQDASGGMVFGAQPKKQGPTTPKSAVTPTKQEDKFAAFTGQGRSLKK